MQVGDKYILQRSIPTSAYASICKGADLIITVINIVQGAGIISRSYTLETNTFDSFILGETQMNDPTWVLPVQNNIQNGCGGNCGGSGGCGGGCPPPPIDLAGLFEEPCDCDGSCHTEEPQKYTGECKHPNKHIVPMMTKSFWYCPDCKQDLGDA